MKRLITRWWDFDRGAILGEQWNTRMGRDTKTSTEKIIEFVVEELERMQSPVSLLQLWMSHLSRWSWDNCSKSAPLRRYTRVGGGKPTWLHLLVSWPADCYLNCKPFACHWSRSKQAVVVGTGSTHTLVWRITARLGIKQKGLFVVASEFREKWSLWRYGCTENSLNLLPRTSNTLLYTLLELRFGHFFKKTRWQIKRG